MKTYRGHGPLSPTPQSEPIPGSKQVANNAGGYAFPVDDWIRLDRFVLLGSTAGTYYVSERKLTRQNADAAERCIKADGLRVVRRIVEISEAGRAPSNDPALFVLAMCASLGNEATRQGAFAALPRVARIGTHIFHFAAYVQDFRGWGRGLRKAIANWYLKHDEEAEMTVSKLAYDVVKYQQRDGWSHRDLLCLAHPRTSNASLNTLFKWIVKGAEALPPVGEQPMDKSLAILYAFEQAKTADTKTLVKLIADANLPREAIPTEKLNDPDVWAALLEKMPYEAMTRNLAKMTVVGLLKPMSAAARTIAERLGDQERILKSRLHPVKILAALKTYEQGHGERGKLAWSPVSQIVDALDAAFYLAFGNVQSTGKRWVLGLDVSWSMAGTAVNGIPGLSAREACAAMALVTAATEPEHAFVAFDTETYVLSISPRQRLDDVVKLLARTGGGGTDCALPIQWALQNKIAADAIVIATDSETWQGAQHPAQAIVEYRRKMSISAKLVVMAMAANEFSVGDTDDAGILNCVGFDTATPSLIADFVQE